MRLHLVLPRHGGQGAPRRQVTYLPEGSALPDMPRATLAAMLLTLAALLLAGCSTPEPQHARLALEQQLPTLDGEALRVAMVEVTYGPGESSAPHVHGCPVVGYVVSGSVRMQVEGQSPDTYEAGETFYEAPGVNHIMSANASREMPAKFLAWFTCDSEAPLSVALAKPEEKR